MTSLLWIWRRRYCPLSPWARAGVRASGLSTRTAELYTPSALIPALSQREKEKNHG
jgi:hypothetical protein